MSIVVDKWQSETVGGTKSDVRAYAETGHYSIVFRQDGHKKLKYNFRSMLDLATAIDILKRGWISSVGGRQKR